MGCVCVWGGNGSFLPLQNDLFGTSAGSKFQFSFVADKPDGNHEDNDYRLQGPQFGLTAKFLNLWKQVTNAKRLNTTHWSCRSHSALSTCWDSLETSQKMIPESL